MGMEVIRRDEELVEAEDDGEEAEKVVDLNCGLEPWTAGTALERVAMAHQASGQWKSLASPTVCRPLLFVLLSCSMYCVSLSVQSVACSVLLYWLILVVVVLLLFSSVCCSTLFCVLSNDYTQFPKLAPIASILVSFNSPGA